MPKERVIKYNLIKKLPMPLINKYLAMFGLKSLNDPTIINPYQCITRYDIIGQYTKNLELFRPYFSYNSRYLKKYKKISFYKVINLFDKCIRHYGYKVVKQVTTYCTDKTTFYYVESINKVYKIGINPVVTFDCM